MGEREDCRLRVHTSFQDEHPQKVRKWLLTLGSVDEMREKKKKLVSAVEPLQRLQERAVLRALFVSRYFTHTVVFSGASLAMSMSKKSVTQQLCIESKFKQLRQDLN